MGGQTLVLRDSDRSEPNTIEASDNGGGVTMRIENPLVGGSAPDRGTIATITLDRTTVRALHHFLTDLLMGPAAVPSKR